MLNVLHSVDSVPARARHDDGPERRAELTHWLTAAFDEIDYGLLLLIDGVQVMYANHAARAELDAAHPLQLVDSELRTRQGLDAQPLADALHAATQRGLRKLLTLGDAAQRICLSIVPIAAPPGLGGPVTLLMLGKRQVCLALSVQGFAHSHRLTGAETRVLTGLCSGMLPSAVAAQHGVAISTVRSQIGTIRVKTGARSIRALVQQVAVLPPLMGVLRGLVGADSAGGTAEERLVA